MFQLNQSSWMFVQQWELGKKSKRKKTKDKREYRKRVHFLNKINQVENKFNFIEQTNEEKA